MLQFIVLGIVPGTSIQLNFTDVLLISGMTLLVLSVSSHYMTRALQKQRWQTLINQIAL